MMIKKSNKVKIVVAMIMILFISLIVYQSLVLNYKEKQIVAHAKNVESIKFKKPDNYLGYISIDNVLNKTDLLEAPFDSSKSSGKKVNQEWNYWLNYGVVLDSDSANLNSKSGNIVLSCHDYSFCKNLKNANNDMMISIKTKQKEYKYKIVEKKVVDAKKGSSVYFKNEKKGLIIYTCKSVGFWDQSNPSKRIVYYAIPI